MTMPTPPPNQHPVLHNIETIAELERDALEKRTRIERVTAGVTRIAGSTAFIVLHLAWFALWIVLNSTRFTFDAYPFSLLNLIVALEAVILTSVVLMTQNQMEAITNRRAQLDLQVNLLAEQELTTMLHMLHGLCTKAGVTVTVHDERVQHLLKETDIQKISDTLDRKEDSE
jgi:uncharacterized membrane protein